MHYLALSLLRLIGNKRSQNAASKTIPKSTNTKAPDAKPLL
jgi:hypothetical protein